MNSPETVYKIISTQDIKEVDIDKLTYLINNSFKSSKKELASDYFEKEDIAEIFYVNSTGESENYLGAAIIQPIKNHDDIFYLDKFIVEETYKGNGLGTALWNAITGMDAITDKYDKLIWRASPDNPANNFYEGKYDKKIETENWNKTENWNIYYKGLDDLRENILKELIKTVANKDPTMIPT